MKLRLLYLAVLVCLLVGCSGGTTPAPDLQGTIDALNRQNTRRAAPATDTPVPTAAKSTPIPPKVSAPAPTSAKGLPSPSGPRELQVELQGCTTSIDITHGLGEVTNAFIVVRNFGPAATNVCAELSASDEGKLHPDKLKCLPRLPEGSQVALKLTVDTTYRENTLLKVNLTADGGKSAVSSEMNCKSLTVSAERALNAVLDLIRPLVK